MWYAIGAMALLSAIVLVRVWARRLEGAETAKRRQRAGSLQRARFKEGDYEAAPRARAPRRGFGRR